MTESERAFLFDDYGPMSKTDLDILRNRVAGGRAMRPESGVARTLVAAYKAGVRAREEWEAAILMPTFEKWAEEAGVELPPGGVEIER